MNLTLTFNNLGIFQSLNMRIFMGKKSVLYLLSYISLRILSVVMV